MFCCFPCTSKKGKPGLPNKEKPIHGDLPSRSDLDTKGQKTLKRDDPYNDSVTGAGDIGFDLSTGEPDVAGSKPLGAQDKKEPRTGTRSGTLPKDRTAFANNS